MKTYMLILTIFSNMPTIMSMQENAIIKAIKDAHKSFDDVKKIIDENPTAINTPNVHEQTPLTISLELFSPSAFKQPDTLTIRNKKIITYLIEKGAKVNPVEGTDSNPVDVALQFQWHDIIPLMLEKGATITTRTIASVAKNKDLLALFMKYQPDINLENENKQTPLMLAVQNKNPDAVKNLLERGANPNAQDKRGNSPLMYIIMINTREQEAAKNIVEQLLQKKADINHINAEQQSALSLAITSKDTKLIEVLLNNGADPMAGNAFFKAGATIDFLEIFLKKIDVNTTNKEKRTALMYEASMRNSFALANVLSKGADPKLKDNVGNTALIYRIQADERYPNQNTIGDITRLLKTANTINEKNLEGETAFTLALDLYGGHTMSSPEQLNVIETLLQFNPDLTIITKKLKRSFNDIVKNYPKSQLALRYTKSTSGMLNKNLNDLDIALRALSQNIQ